MDRKIMNETLNERIYAEEPVIAGVIVRPFSLQVKLKLQRIARWLQIEEQDQNEELLYAFLYLIAAPIERVAINTLNREAYLVDKDTFLATLSPADLTSAAEWFVKVSELEKETEIEVVAKPTSGPKETAPPNS